MIPLAQIRRLMASAALAMSLLCGIFFPTCACASSPGNCIAVTAGAIYAIGIAGVPEYGKPWMRSSTRLGKLMEKMKDRPCYRTVPATEAEKLILGSPALGRIAEFVQDPVGEVSQCIRKVTTPIAREYGQASHGPKSKFSSNFFVRVSFSDPGGGLSVKYRF